MAQHQVYGFGPYRLELATRRLLRASEPVALTPKAFDVLVALVERHDRVVDKAELMKLVWPDSFVEEANLSQTIFVLRKTLGDDDDGRPFIDTVPRRGYRFAAEVRDLAEPVALGSDEGRRDRGRSVRWLTAAIGVVALSAAAGLWQTKRHLATTADVVAGKTRVAVLPFENLTGNRAEDWLASAFSDSLTTGLESVEGLICVSRDRVVELYQQDAVREASALDSQALRKMSQALGVRYYVHGSYQKLGDRIKVIAQLVETEGGTISAQESVTDSFSSLLMLEDDLARRFAAKLEPGQLTTAAHRETSSLEAYEAVVLGRNAYAAGAFTEALGLLRRGVQLDPSYARAWALLSEANARLTAGSSYVGGSISGLNQTALTSARRAVEINPSLYEAHTALSLAYRELEELDPWRDEATKAVALNPRAPEGYALLADLYFATPGFGCSRRRDAALAESYYETALSIDPRFQPARGNLSYHLHWSGRIDEALRVADEGLRVLPGNRYLRRSRSMALVWLNRLDEAEQESRDIGREGQSLEDRWVLATIALKRGHAATASKEFEAVLTAMPATVYDFQIARSYFFADHVEEGLAHIDRAVRRNAACASYAETTPAFTRYRETPAFRARLAAWKSTR